MRSPLNIETSSNELLRTQTRKFSVPFIPSDTFVSFGKRKISLASGVDSSETTEIEPIKSLHNWKTILRPDTKFSRKLRFVPSVGKIRFVQGSTENNTKGTIRKALENKVKKIAIETLRPAPYFSPTNERIVVQRLLNEYPKRVAEWKKRGNKEQEKDKFMAKLSSAELATEGLDKVKARLIEMQKTKYHNEIQLVEKLKRKNVELLPFSFDQKEDDHKMKSSKYMQDFENDVKMRISLRKKDIELYNALPELSRVEPQRSRKYEERTTVLYNTAKVRIDELFKRQQERQSNVKTGLNIKGKELILAVKKGDFEKTIEIINQDKSAIYAADHVGLTPLHWACKKGNNEIAALLLKAGADPNSRDMFKRTPSDIAAKYGNVIPCILNNIK